MVVIDDRLEPYLSVGHPANGTRDDHARRNTRSDHLNNDKIRNYNDFVGTISRPSRPGRPTFKNFFYFDALNRRTRIFLSYFLARPWTVHGMI